MAAPVQSTLCRCVVAKASTLHPRATMATASHRGAAASLLDQTELRGGSSAEHTVQVRGRGGTPSPPDCQYRDKHATSP